MSEIKSSLPEEVRREYENSEIPLAVYQLIDGRVRTILISNGLSHWQAPELTREDMIHLLDTDMYRDVHPEDLAFIATKTAEFSKQKDGTTTWSIAKNYTARNNTALFTLRVTTGIWMTARSSPLSATTT